jgi:hypothetical protein
MLYQIKKSDHMLVCTWYIQEYLYLMQKVSIFLVYTVTFCIKYIPGTTYFWNKVCTGIYLDIEVYSGTRLTDN